MRVLRIFFLHLETERRGSFISTINLVHVKPNGWHCCQPLCPSDSILDLS